MLPYTLGADRAINTIVPVMVVKTHVSQSDDLKLEDLEYDLPSELIAQTPSPVRHESRLFVVERSRQSFRHHHFHQIKDILKAGDLLVVNDTRVIPSRLFARRASGGIIKLLLVRPHLETLESSGAAKDQTACNLWQAMVTPIKRLQVGEELLVLSSSNHREKQYSITIKEFILDHDGYKRLVVDLGSQEDVFELLRSVGFAPLPPYIVRDKPDDFDMMDDADAHNRLSDLDRYQTVFANHPGAVAAPTAGLHFSDELLAELRNKGIDVRTVTLHVGPGTFKPISSDVDSHTIERERFCISNETADAINRAKSEGRRVIAVGTTSLRALETAGATGTVIPTDGESSTSLYVKPGFEFKVVDALLTNFHLSKSSLLVLVATFGGKRLILDAYKEAVQERYRFFSYGDAMLIL